MYQSSPKVAMIDVGMAIADLRSHLFHDLDGVGSGLAADLEEDGTRAIDVGDGLGIGFAVLDARHVGNSDRVAVLLADDNLVELGDRLHPAAGPERDRLRSLIDAAAGNLDVLSLERT
jgi:hypothetical protein